MHSDKESACLYRRCKRAELDPWVGKISWSRKWEPTPVFWPGKFHGQTGLESYSSWSHKESDTTECTHIYERADISSFSTLDARVLPTLRCV